MKAIKNLYKVLAVCVLLILSACTNLNENVYDKLSDDNLTFSDEDLSRMTGTVYAKFRDTYWRWNGMFDLYEESSDLMMTPTRLGIGWGDLYIPMHQHKFNPGIDHYYINWFFAWNGITYANKLLDLKQISDNPLVSAELRTMRALFYYILFDNFRNIPLETKPSLDKSYLPEQVAPQVMFDFIVSELKEVKGNLTSKRTDFKFGYPNKYVAEMILAKVYLNHNAWFNDFTDNNYYELALAEVDDIITNGGYVLSANYKDNFKADLSENKEIIFGIPLDYTYAGGNYLVSKSLIAAGTKAYGFTGAAWDGSCAIPQFMDTYHANDKRFDATWAHGQQYDFETGDPIKTDADDEKDANLIYTKEVHSINNPGAYMLEGYRFVKNEIVAGPNGTSGDDVPFFRLADAMFIKAECLLRLGRDQAVAASLVTDVRRRAFASASEATRTIANLTDGSIYDYGHREWKSVGAKNFDPALFEATYEGGDDIELGGLLDDLAWEFVGEHHRKQDLIRFRLTSGVSAGMNVYRGKSWFCKDAETAVSDVHTDIFPIFKQFIDANPKMKQNPGY